MLVAGVTACAALPPEMAAPDPALPRRVELVDTPFFAQERYQCGPAALATVLTASGSPASPEALVDQVYVPARKGSLKAEMLAATRRAERLPYPIDGTLSAIAAELADGRPVLVLQNLGVSWLPRWHYAVVVGIDLDRDEIILRSGTEQRRTTDIDLFLRTWQRSNGWGFVALQPGQLPADVSRDRYYRVVADMESTGHSAAARRAWEAALERWPEDPVALFGLGNVALTLGDTREAELLYRRLIEVDPSQLMARNNLAYALAGQGRYEEARRELGRALAVAPPESAAAAVLRDSLEELAGTTP